MLCCLETPWSNPHDSYRNQTNDFPGNRRFQKTAGNALVLAATPTQQHWNNNNNYQHQDQSATNNIDGGDIVCVTVPPGVSPGQAIMVTAPDGSGRTVMATVPQGMTAGSTFMAEFPPYASSPPASVVSSSVGSAAGPPRPAQVEVEPVDYSSMQVLPPPPATSQTSEPFATAVPIGAGPNDTTISASPNRPLPAPVSPPHSPMPATFGQTMLRVQVPPGTAPGTTLHVSVPGEQLTIPAVVPSGNVSSFHIPYTPSTQPTPVTVAPSNTNSQKLLLVRVPPGTAPGTTLHVSIPDEPGRLVAATVPPNVSEFQVAYTPSVNNRSQQQQHYNRSAPPRNSNNNRNSSYNNNGNNMGSMLLPALGGAALGMAGMSMFNHAHYNNNNGYDNAGDYGDAGNDDYGGNDFSGDFDGGGGFGDFGDF